MKKKYNKLELSTGFIMGFFPGLFIELVVIAVNNFFCRWRGCGLIEPRWWMVIPIPIIAGVTMAISIANLHLEDY